MTEKQKEISSKLGSSPSIGNNAKQKELCRSQLASILSTSTNDRCQELIDKVSEMRYLKVRERQINKFNRVLPKKEGNITWSAVNTPVNSVLPAVSASSLQAGNTSPQASIAPQAASNSQAGSQLANNNRKSVLILSILSRQVIGSSTPQAVSANPQGDSAVPPRQAVPRQTVLIPRQSVLNPQVLIVFPQAGSSSQASSQLVNSNIVCVSQTGRQVIVSSNPQAVSTNSQGASAVPPQAGRSQADSTDCQAVSAESLGANNVFPWEVAVPRQEALVLR